MRKLSPLVTLCAFAGVIALALFVAGPSLAGYAYFNLGNLQFLRFYIRQGEDSSSASAYLQRAANGVQRSAYYLHPTYAVSVRQGELGYLLGDWESGDQGWLQSLTLKGLKGSRPLSESQQRLEALFLARQAEKQENIIGIVQYLRIALICGLPELGHDYYKEYEQELQRALASFYEHRWFTEQEPGWAVRAAKYYWRAEEYVRAEELVINALKAGGLSTSHKGEAFLIRAMWLESRGDLPRAAAFYEQALSHDPHLVKAYLRLIKISEQTGNSERAAFWRQRLEYLEPENRIDHVLPIRGGTFVQSSEEGPGQWLWNEVPLAERWILEGYDVDEDLLEDGIQVPVTLFWNLPTVAIPQGDAWYPAGDHWLQMVEAVNLVPNAGFEWDMPADQLLPAGFPYLNYLGQTLANQAIVVTERAGRQTRALELRNMNGITTVGLRSVSCPVTDGFYLQAGWVRTTDARANLGRYWLGGGLAYDYVASPHSSSVSQWTHWAAITRSVPGATKAQTFLLSWNNTGRAQFDNLLMFKLEDVPWPARPIREQD